ncbi:MAG TPA: hypothetical protein VN181_02940, partial [Thermoanaerobaculia bacterium]|nr:hypothetical protein [Thermoanaerobaculia bacterium]
MCLITALLVSIEAPAATGGTLCTTTKLDAAIDSKSPSCFAVNADALAKQTVRGSFAWFADDGKLITAGHTGEPAALGTIDFVDLVLSMSGSDPELWPVPVTVRLTSRDNAHVTTVAISPSAVPRLQKLRVPRNQYDLVLNAIHHRALLRTVSPQGSKPYYVGTLNLIRLPFIR